MMNDSQIGTTIAEKYRLKNLVREASRGDLYVAEHEITGESVMLLLLPQAVAIDERWSRPFIDSAKSAANLTAPSVLRIVDLGIDRSGAAYVAFEAFDGTPLYESISDIGRTDEKRAARIGLQIADAVAAANEQGLIHGCLSPDQILIADYAGRETIKVFGFSNDKFESSRGADAKYIAPELNNEFPAVSETSDVFSIGAIVYEMLTGSKPTVVANGTADVDGVTPVKVIRPDIDARLEPIVMTAVARDPEQRYPSAAALAKDLRLYLGESSDARSAAAAAGSFSNTLKTAAIVLAGVILLGGGIIYATYYRGTDPTVELVADEGSLPVQPIGPATGAQEESLSQLPALTDAELLAATTATMELPPGTLPGGDGYNAWANGGAPPPGAPPGQQVPQYFPPAGQMVTIDPAGGSQFMPQEGGVVLVPVPANTPQRPATNQRPATGDEQPTAETPAANTAAPPRVAATPKPLATPPPRNQRPPTTDQPATESQPATQPRTNRRGNQRQTQQPESDRE